MATESASGPVATLEQIKVLLRAKDDTSRFVGLALLKSVLDVGNLPQNSKDLRDLWESVSCRFLDRLLKARQNDKISQGDSKDMVDLAAAVLHTFSILLPEECRRDKRLTGRTAPLLKALLNSSSDTTKLILQTLVAIVSSSEGAIELLHTEDISSLVEVAPEHPLVLDILSFAWTNAALDSSEALTVQEKINQHIPSLITSFKGTDGVTFIKFLADLFPRLDSQVVPRSPRWLPSSAEMIRNLVLNKPTSAGRAAYTQLSSVLLQTYPATCPSLLFRDSDRSGSDSKPFAYLFINLVLVDLRSSFPSLLAQLNDAQYPSNAQRLASACDILSAFIAYLIRSLDEEVNTTGFSLDPDLLLNLRKNIAETISLSIEYLRDRWDASIAGASGLHPDARIGTAATSEGIRLTLTWESIKDQVHTDPLVLASIRAMAIWIREDDNDNLRNEAAGMMDMLIELYKSSNLDEKSLDFRYPILMALEGTISTDDGADTYLRHEGWETVFSDLKSIVQSIAENSDSQEDSVVSNANRGLQIIRVLLAVVDHESQNTPQEAWMSAVTFTTSIKAPKTTPMPVVLELLIGMLQLSAALLEKTSHGTTKRYMTTYPALSGLTRQLEKLVDNLEDEQERFELKELLEDLALGLENLRLG